MKRFFVSLFSAFVLGEKLLIKWANLLSGYPFYLIAHENNLTFWSLYLNDDLKSTFQSLSNNRVEKFTFTSMTSRKINLFNIQSCPTGLKNVDMKF